MSNKHHRKSPSATGHFREGTPQREFKKNIHQFRIKDINLNACKISNPSMIEDKSIVFGSGFANLRPKYSSKSSKSPSRQIVRISTKNVVRYPQLETKTKTIQHSSKNNNQQLTQAVILQKQRNFSQNTSAGKPVTTETEVAKTIFQESANKQTSSELNIEQLQEEPREYVCDSKVAIFASNFKLNAAES